METARKSLGLAVVAMTTVALQASDRTTGLSAPDLIVSDIPSIQIFANDGNEVAMSLAMTACNLGDAAATWQASTNQHPLFAQNMYRLADGRLEQIGQSWVRHGICALALPGCATCTRPAPPCTSLGVGCSSPSVAASNGHQSSMGPKVQVNPRTGVFPWPPAQGEGIAGPLSRRLRVKVVDVGRPGAQYFAEGQFVHPGDSAAGAQDNNVSYRPFDVTVTSALATGPVVLQRAGPEIWQDQMPDVVVVDVVAPSGGLFKLGYRAWEDVPGTWNYEYALYNMNSDVPALGFWIQAGATAAITEIGFHDVDYHSGDGLDDTNVDGTDWIGFVEQRQATIVEWGTDASDPNGNALRWGTMYNFRFQSDAAPHDSFGMIEFAGASIGVTIATPGAPPCAADLDGDNVVGFDDLVSLLSEWGPCGVCPQDFTGDGLVAFDDLLTLLSQWGPCPG